MRRSLLVLAAISLAPGGMSRLMLKIQKRASRV